MSGATSFLTRWLRPSIDSFLRLFYPEVCQFCFQNKALHEEGYICSYCKQDTSPIEAPLCKVCGDMFPGDFAELKSFICESCRSAPPCFDWARAAVQTGDLPLQAIYKYKYGGCLWVEPWLGEMLIDCAAKWITYTDWDMIIPVPLYPSKKKKRGFNQAERLGRILSRHTGVVLNTELVHRVKNTRTQTQLSHEERIINLKGAFNISSTQSLSGKRILIVDDVLTTGATCSEVARVLKKKEAEFVCVLTICRGTPLVRTSETFQK